MNHSSFAYSTSPRYWFRLQSPVTFVTKVAFIGSLAIEANNEWLELLYPLSHHLGPLLNLLPGYIGRKGNKFMCLGCSIYYKFHKIYSFIVPQEKKRI